MPFFSEKLFDKELSPWLPNIYSHVISQQRRYWFVLSQEQHLAVGHVTVFVSISNSASSGNWPLSNFTNASILLPRGLCHFAACGVMKTKFGWQLNVRKEKPDTTRADNDCARGSTVSYGCCDAVFIPFCWTHTHTHTIVQHFWLNL